MHVLDERVAANAAVEPAGCNDGELAGELDEAFGDGRDGERDRGVVGLVDARDAALPLAVVAPTTGLEDRGCASPFDRFSRVLGGVDGRKGAVGRPRS